jgi:hypothetical protein
MKITLDVIKKFFFNLNLAQHTDIQNPTSLEIESIQSPYQNDSPSNYDTSEGV